MNRCRVLFQSPFLGVKQYDHPPEVLHQGVDQVRSTVFSVNFIEQGSFSVSWERQRRTATRDTILVTTPGLAYRVRHHEEVPTDVILGLEFKDAWRDELAELALDRPVARCPVAPMNNRRAYLRWRLVSRLKHTASTLSTESIGAELLATLGDNGGAGLLYRDARLSRYASRVDAVRELLDETYTDDHSLVALAREARMSPFHFARVFRELAGVPPHRYLILRRLAAAADSLIQGRSVTSTCFAVGFTSLSHFTRSFSKVYGMAPSRLARVGSSCWRRRRPWTPFLL